MSRDFWPKNGKCSRASIMHSCEVRCKQSAPKYVKSKDLQNGCFRFFSAVISTTQKPNIILFLIKSQSHLKFLSYPKNGTLVIKQLVTNSMCAKYQSNIFILAVWWANMLAKIIKSYILMAFWCF